MLWIRQLFTTEYHILNQVGYGWHHFKALKLTCGQSRSEIPYIMAPKKLPDKTLSNSKGLRNIKGFMDILITLLNTKDVI